METKINELKFYYGNTNRVGVMYFDSEDIIKAGIDTTGKIISIFGNAGFLTKEIHLAGGVSELSHTGDLAYGAVYNDAKAFLDNAYSDYAADREKAEEETKGWLSSYNFEYFFVLLRKNETDVRVFVRAGKNITIKYDDCNDIAPDIKKIACDIKKDLYQGDCVIEGMEKLEHLLDEHSLAKDLEKKPLFVISLGGMPLLLSGDVILMYADKRKADTAVKRFILTLKEKRIKVMAIDKNKDFIAQMTACGLRKFLMNGEGEIWDFARFCDIDTVKNIKNGETIYEKIKAMQKYYTPAPVKTTELLKKLPKIHKNRLISSFIIAILTSVFFIVLSIYKHIISGRMLPILFLISVYMDVYGLISASKVYNKLKEKNPKVAKLALYVMMLYLIPAICIVYIISSL